MKQILIILLLYFSYPIYSINLNNSKRSKEDLFTPELSLYSKMPGNPATAHNVTISPDFKINNSFDKIQLNLSQKAINPNKSIYTIRVEAKEDVNFHVQLKLNLKNMPHADVDFLMPGLWYKRNLKVSDGAPSMSISNNWMFREDRLSTPLSAAYNPSNRNYFALKRADNLKNDYLLSYNGGEVIMFDNGDLGSLGFGENSGNTYLSGAYPVSETPGAYTQKLKLTRPIMVFRHLKKGQIIEINYEFLHDTAPSYSDFVRDIWFYSYNSQKPIPIVPTYTDAEVKQHLSGYYKESFTDEYPLKGYSGVHVHIDKCEKRGIIEVGFIGRIFLNAFYALQYGEQTNDQQLINEARETYDSYLKNGFTNNGFIREKVDFQKNVELEELSIRRQSEGIMALLYFLNYENSQGRKHPVWEKKIVTLLDRFIELQRADYSFPRKFNNEMEIIDDTGGSSSCAILPLTMAYKYFNNPKYLTVAEKTAEYMKKESVDKGDYFSSTLDARCEDKEASIYITTAYYYLWLATGKQEYIENAKKSVYFSLSYYYTWDVPFAKGQMLGDLGLKTRGWGNVSVENNHIDVYIFEFIDVLNWLSSQTGEKRLKDFGEVIANSIQDQLLPVEGRLCGIAKPGYYPEVVQHTNWDYGFNGKGYYNTLFGPGWVVASIWTMLSSGNTENYFNGNLVSK